MTDTERKVLQILWSLSRGQGLRIDIRRLQRLSQRSQAQIQAALRQLAVEEYIQQDGITIKVLRLPERDVQRTEIRYWEYD